MSGDFPAALGSLTSLKVTRFASNTDADDNPSLTGCVPLGLRYLLTAPDFESTVPDPDRRVLNLPAQDFITEDVNGDGDTDDPEDTPGLNLPFCMLSALTFSDVSLGFATATAAYTADVASTVESTTVTATLDADAESSDRLSIRKGTASYTSGAAVPLAVGSNEITVTVTPTDGTPTLTYTVTIFRAGVDQETLVALYNSAGGASWTDKTNWLSTTEPLNDWFGVEADASGNVTKLELPGNNLSGSLLATLGSLTSLITLDLSDNQLERRRSPTSPAVTSLAALDLGDNQLSGTIPEELGSLTGLQDLSLRDNRLTGAIPEELGNLNRAGCPVPRQQPAQRGDPGQVGSVASPDCRSHASRATAWRDACPTGCARLVTATDVDSLPAQDFLADDANSDGDTDDVGDTPGLGLPFCTLQSLTLSDVTLEPVFASDTVVYTASAEHAVTSPTITATLRTTTATPSPS